MYEIKPENVKAFITDRSIRLPRFQRKQTWDEKKNFQLCISVFKDYPIGVCILSRQSGNKSGLRWLLDGRQRKNALSMMYEDPENIYNWAQKFIKFKNSDQPDELKDKFLRKIKEYLEEDSLMKDEMDSESDPIDNDDMSIASESASETDYEGYKEGLDLLLEIILIVHNKKAVGTGFTLPFDFCDCIEKIPYLENGKYYLSSKKLKTFIDEYRTFCDNNDFDYSLSGSFYEFLESRVVINNPSNLKKLVNERWSEIIKRIDILNRIDTLLTQCTIGVIEVKNLNASDSQKIFEIINSEGEKLTAVEILSAKPSWNTCISNVSGEMQEAVQSLYRQMGIVRPENIVKWDLPATLLRRIDTGMFLKKFSSSKKSDFEKELTIGFQLMAGIYERSITKNSIENLSGNKDIKWETDYEKLIVDLSQMLKLIRTSDYFRYLKSWRTSIQELTSLGCALNFILVAYLSWVKSGKPIGNDSNAKIFMKNCFILWDKLIYEYVNRQWSGSMDSKISNYLDRLMNNGNVFDPVASEKWAQILNDIFDKSRIGDSEIKIDLMKPLLYHFYCLNHLSGPDSEHAVEIDHILPQTKFEESQINQKDLIKDNLFNLGLLPKDENVSKSNKTLRSIESEWLRQEVEKYEQIPLDKFEYFSDINNFRDLFALRKKHFDKAYGELRTNLINN